MIQRKGQLSRADLLDALVADNKGATQYLSRKLGLIEQSEPDTPPITIIDKPHTDEIEQPIIIDAGIKPSAGFWLLQKRETTVQSNRSEQISSPVSPTWTMQTAELPVHHLLSSRRSLLARLFHHLKYQRVSREIDIEAIIKKISRGEYLLRLPRTMRRSLGHHLHIIDDRQIHLTPYWRDHSVFAHFITSQLPDYLSSRAVLQQGQSLPVSVTHTGQLTNWELPPKNSIVLILSDLGTLMMQSDEQINVWLNLGRMLQNHGCKLIALLPCHPTECDWRLKSLFTMESWENRQHIQPDTKEQRLEQAEKLLMLLSPAIRLEPSLLRSVRKALAQHNIAINAAVESIAWQHPAMQEPSSVAATLNTETRKQWLTQFYTEESELQKTVLNLMRTWRTVLQPQIWFEEIINLDDRSRSSIAPADIEAAEHYFSQLIANGQLTADIETQLWLLRMEKRLQADSCRLPQLGVILQDVISQLHKNDENYRTDLPLDPRQLPPTNEPEQTAVLYQQGERVILHSSLAPNRELVGYSRLTSIRYRRTLLKIEPDGLASQSLSFQADGQHDKFVCSLPDTASLTLHSDMESLFFSQVQRPPWLDCLGRDVYGLYADLSINNITQRFRWVEAGRFLMGSPENEKERYDDEVQHEVTLTQGFWLADTTVTQALWLAVMGNNPSEFKDDVNNPVERVSWDDVQDFIAKLNRLNPELHAQLPSEARWEYACRAGSTMPFSFGDNITPEQVNYNGNYPYAGGNKGLYRQKTVAVKSLPANAWGLYEMHGNVWEWCQDYWTEQLPKQPATDPKGAKTGSARVVRGGSWLNVGRRVRSAIRLRYAPDFRYDDLGFRLALGLELRSGQAFGTDSGSRVAEQRQTVAEPKAQGKLATQANKLKNFWTDKP
jgi:formylglycine-generating enzyme required for sulfatase activity